MLAVSTDNFSLKKFRYAKKEKSYLESERIKGRREESSLSFMKPV